MGDRDGHPFVKLVSVYLDKAELGKPVQPTCQAFGAGLFGVGLHGAPPLVLPPASFGLSLSVLGQVAPGKPAIGVPPLDDALSEETSYGPQGQGGQRPPLGKLECCHVDYSL